ncbi:hypothetical protein Hdeb2414_s0283g00856611 [Helianthus debilis subsp. tardiflorus]
MYHYKQVLSMKQATVNPELFTDIDHMVFYFKKILINLMTWTCHTTPYFWKK